MNLFFGQNFFSPGWSDHGLQLTRNFYDSIRLSPALSFGHRNVLSGVFPSQKPFASIFYCTVLSFQPATKEHGRDEQKTEHERARSLNLAQ